MRLLMRAAGAVGLSVVLAATASAQGVQVGVKAGWDRAMLGGNDVSGMEARNDFAGGLFLTFNAGRVLALQPEVLYVPKGAQVTETEQGMTATVKLKLDYAEVPLLVRLNIPMQNSSIRPALFAGPFLAFKTTCKVDVSATGFSGSFDCNDSTLGTSNNVKSTDVGATFGGGLELPLGGANAFAEARYDLGLATIDATDNPGDVKTRNILVFVGFSFPIGGGKTATQRTR